MCTVVTDCRSDLNAWCRDNPWRHPGRPRVRAARPPSPGTLPEQHQPLGLALGAHGVLLGGAVALTKAEVLPRVSHHREAGEAWRSIPTTGLHPHLSTMDQAAARCSSTVLAATLAAGGTPADNGNSHSRRPVRPPPNGLAAPAAPRVVRGMSAEAALHRYRETVSYSK